MVTSTRVSALSLGFLGVCASSLVGLTAPAGVSQFVDLRVPQTTVAEGVIARPLVTLAMAPQAMNVPVPVVAPLPTDRPVAHIIKASFTPNPANPAPLNNDASDKSSVTHLPYGFRSVRDENTGVARVFVPTMPKINPVAGGDARKVAFLQAILPLVLKVNEQIAADRKHLQAIIATQKAGEAVSPEDQSWLQAQADYYNLDTPKPSLLLTRMDIVPPSLALAQAAVETGWGSSPLARKHNALFGQGRTGTVHRHDPIDAAGHPFKTFPTLLAAVESYMHNLNTHDAYRNFRTVRAGLRQSKQALTGKQLATTLTSYSELGKGYTSLIRSTIASNNLGHYDTAWLADETDLETYSLVQHRR